MRQLNDTVLRRAAENLKYQVFFMRRTTFVTGVSEFKYFSQSFCRKMYFSHLIRQIFALL